MVQRVWSFRQFKRLLTATAIFARHGLRGISQSCSRELWPRPYQKKVPLCLFEHMTRVHVFLAWSSCTADCANFDACGLQLKMSNSALWTVPNEASINTRAAPNKKPSKLATSARGRHHRDAPPHIAKNRSAPRQKFRCKDRVHLHGGGNICQPTGGKC